LLREGGTVVIISDILAEEAAMDSIMVRKA